MLRAYRDFRVMLNVNSVVDSSTMFARRVFEALACQSNVVSTGSEGLEQMLGDVVAVVTSEEQAREEIDGLLDNPLLRERRAHRAWRKVMREHTYARRLHTIAKTVGSTIAGPRAMPMVSVVVLPGTSGYLDGLVEAAMGQTYPHVELLIVHRRGEPLDRRLQPLAGGARNGRRVPVADITNSEELIDAAARHARGQLLTFLDSRDRYGSEFVWDLVSAREYCTAQVVGKPCHYVAVADGREADLVGAEQRHRHVTRIPLRACLVAKETLRAKTLWKVDPNGTLASPSEAPQDEAPWGYATDPFCYVRDAYAGAPAAISTGTRRVPIEEVIV
jgi:hypothetical protein